MAKIFGVLLIVLGVWLGMEIYTKGMDGAFGGALARFTEPVHTNERTPYDPSEKAAAERETRVTTGTRGSLAQRAGERVRADLAAGARRDGAESDDGDSDEEDNN
jgi:hypothetical protein